MWPSPGLLPVSWLGVTPHDTDLFMSLQSPHNRHNPQSESILIIRMSPPPFRSYSPHSLERRGMNTEHVWPEPLCLLCDHPLCSVQRRGPWERFRVSDVLRLYQCCPQQPWWWHLTPISPTRSLFPDLPRTVIKIWWEPITYNTD